MKSISMTSLILDKYKAKVGDSRWIAGAVLVAALIVIFVIVSVWGLQTRSRASQLADHADRLRTLAGPDLPNADPDSLDALIAELDQLTPDPVELQESLGPARFASSLLGWAPWIGGKISSTPKLVDRAAWDVQAARDVSVAFKIIADLFRDLGGSFDDLHEMYASGAISRSLREADQALDTADELLAKSEASAANSDITGQGGRIGEYARILTDQESRVREFADWGGLVVRLALDLEDVILSAEPLLEISNDGGLDKISRSEQTGGMLGALAVSSRRAASTADEVAGLTPADIRQTAIERDLLALGDALRGMEALADGAQTGLVAALPAVELLAASDRGLLEDGEAILAVVEALAAEIDALEFAVLRLEEAQASFASGGSVNGGAPAFLEDIIGLTSDAASALSFAEALPDVAPDLLGVDGPKSHLVLGQTSDELRATGGFVSGIWVVTFNRGALVDRLYFDVVEVDDLDNLILYPAPPDPLVDHMAASNWLLRDISWEPNFPVTAAIARELFRLGQGRAVDGVFALTPGAFLKIAEVLGSIPTPDGDLPAEQLMQALETGTDEQGREYMDVLFQGMLDGINSKGALKQALELAAALEKALEEKDALVNFTDARAQDAMARLGWAGEIFPRSFAHEGDRLFVLDSNIGWSKVDRNIQRSMTYRVGLSEDGPVKGQFTLGYQNTSEYGAVSCDFQRTDRGQNYDLLKNAYYWNYLRVLLHPSAKLRSADLFPLPANSIAVATGRGIPEEDTAIIRQVASGVSFEGLVTAAPGERINATFSFDLPPSVVRWNDTTATHSLELQAQPGMSGRDARVELAMPDGWEYVRGSIPPMDQADGSVVFEIDLVTDQMLYVEMERSN